MLVSVVTPPSAIVPLADVKAHLNVIETDDDALISAYLAAATGTIDGPDGWLGRALGAQTLEARLDALAGELIRLPCRPLIEIVSVKYDDDSGVEQTLAADQYTLDPEGLLVAYGAAWPSSRARRGAVRIRYRAGYADGAVPAPIRAAVLLMVGDLYAQRETAVVGAISARVPMSTTVENLLSPYRIWSSC